MPNSPNNPRAADHIESIVSQGVIVLLAAGVLALFVLGLDQAPPKQHAPVLQAGVTAGSD